MNFIDKIFYRPNERRLRKAQSINNPPAILRAEADVAMHQEQNMDVPRNQEILYAQLTWIQSAVGTISGMAATTPLEVFMEKPTEEMEAVQNHEYEQRLRKPNPMQSRMEYLQAVFSYFKITGNSYTWLNKANELAPPDEMWTIPSHQIRPVADNKMYLLGYKYNPGTGREILLEPWEIMHFKTFNPFSRYIGLSPIEAIRYQALADIAMQKWNKNFFDEGNAKPAGILAWADTMDKATWMELKRTTKDEYGGTKRALMMLQGTGSGDIKWIQTTLSQADMDFLKSRQFTKEEIYELFAPGLGSWLAINSTEANSVTGRAALFELAVYPLHTAFAEKVTNDIMPLYGENLVARFQDVRTEDKIAKLKDQEAYERTHRIDEVREKWYGDDPIGDERGNLTPLELTGRKQPGDLQGFSDLKAVERAQFKSFVKGRMKDGCYEEIDNFEFNYLDAQEQAALKAEIKPSPEMLFTQLREAIQEYA